MSRTPFQSHARRWLTRSGVTGVLVAVALASAPAYAASKSRPVRLAAATVAAQPIPENGRKPSQRAASASEAPKGKAPPATDPVGAPSPVVAPGQRATAFDAAPGLETPGGAYGLGAQPAPKASPSPGAASAPGTNASEKAIPTVRARAVESWSSLDAAQKAQRVGAARALPFPERVLEHSGRFLDTPYLVSPLGEGEGIDPDPTLRYDAVDCLTFVEEVLALSLASRIERVPGFLEQLRYGSEPTYVDRNHLMEAQWLPRNIAKRFIRNVTREYGGDDVVEAKKSLTALTWTSKSSQALLLPKTAQPLGEFTLDIIPLAKVLEKARAVPSGTLLVVVRTELPLKPTRITHLGFVVQKGKRTYLRHAARNPFLRVVDEDLEGFLLRNGRYTKWPVEGVAFYAPMSERERPPDAAEADGTNAKK